jgi:hypothetical protein
MAINPVLAMNDEKESPKEEKSEPGLATKMAILNKQIEDMDPKDKSLPKLMEKRKRLGKEIEIKRTEKRLRRMMEDIDDDTEEFFF